MIHEKTKTKILGFREFLLSCFLQSLWSSTWVSWRYLPSTDILCRPQFCRFLLPSFLCCFVFSFNFCLRFLLLFFLHFSLSFIFLDLPFFLLLSLMILILSFFITLFDDLVLILDFNYCKFSLFIFSINMLCLPNLPCFFLY